MINVVASLTIREDVFDEWLELFKANVPNVLGEEGCVFYDPNIDFDSGWDRQAKDPLVVTVLERWETMDALDAHSKAPHMAALREATKGMVTSVQLKVLEKA